MNYFTALVLGFAIQAPPAPTQSPSDTEQDIVVVGATKEYRLTAKELHAAVEAFRKHRPKYAPRSQLWFEVSPRRSGASLAGVELALVNATSRLPLSIGPDRRFLYPSVEGDDWRLVSTKAGLPLRINPWVVSPGTTPTDLRFGDLQVQCRIVIAIERQSASFVVAGMFDAIGGCASSRIGIYQDFGRHISAASIEEGGKRAPIATWHGTALRMPTNLKGYSPEARVRIQYR